DRNIVRHSVRSLSRSSDRTRSISASSASRSTGRRAMLSRRLATRLALALRRGFPGDDAIDPLLAALLGHERQAELVAHHPGKEAADRVGLQPVSFMIVAMVAPWRRLSIPITRACFESARPRLAGRAKDLRTFFL